MSTRHAAAPCPSTTPSRPESVPFMSPSLRVGLIGCGRIAQLVHLNALRAADGVDVVALADPDAERLHEAAQKAPGAVPYASAEDLLAKSDSEAVILCTPPALHAQGANTGNTMNKPSIRKAKTSASDTEARRSWGLMEST